MKAKNKIRIYELAKSLVPENLSAKEKKNLQTNKTRLILDACQSLGLRNKTPSSSLDSTEVSQIMAHMDDVVSPSQIKQNINSDKGESPASQKKTRVVRRIISKPQSQEKPEPTEEKEEITEEIVYDRKIPSEALPIQKELQEDLTELPDEIKVEDEAKVEKDFLEENMTQTENNDINEIEKAVKKASSSTISKKSYNMPSQNNRKSIIITPKPKQENSSDTNKTNNNNNSKRGTKTTQPYRVAKPLNIQFGNFRRKGSSKKNASQKNNKHSNRNKDRNISQIEQAPQQITVDRSLTVQELAKILRIPETEVIRILFMKGIMRTVNQSLDKDMIKDVAGSLNCEVIFNETQSIEDEQAESLKDVLQSKQTELNKKNLQRRPPVVTIMGHVDHGKTTLLDAIREGRKDITASESGGITQHIGAYQTSVVDYDGKNKQITFLDTPGHEAFTALRARGARVTDIAILVVSADDGVMPQTLEAISHAKAAEVPIVVAVNKIDKPEANPDKVLGQLAEHDLIVEDYGGAAVCSHISAKQKLNLDDLLAKVTLVADVELGDKLLASTDSKAIGTVIEAALSSNKGSICTFLVQSGTLCKGDAVAAGSAYGRIRAIFNDLGQEIEEATPSTPVQILGLDQPPQAGDTFEIYNNFQEARKKASEIREKLQASSRVRSLERLSSAVREDSSVKELRVIIKSDVQGSAEAVVGELNKLSSDKVFVKVIHSAAGAVTESDVNLAATTDAVIVNFNSIVDASSSKLANDNKVSIYTYDVIYKVTEAIKKALGGLLGEERVEIKSGQAEIRQVFSIGKNKVAGCYVTEGKLIAGSIAKIIRNSKEIVSLNLGSLRRFKDNVKEVLEGFECGIALEGFNDFYEGDIIESWQIEFQERTLD